MSGRTLLVATDHGLKAIVLPGAQRLILGRHDAGSATQPDIDLSPFAGLAAGVSRQHAALSFAELTATLTDLNSRNGTYLNGKRLPPSLPHIVSSGDEIRLGKLLIYLHL